MSTDLSATRQLARQRAQFEHGRTDVTDEEIEAEMPRANSVPPAMNPDAVSAREERQQRVLKAHPSPRKEPGYPIIGSPQ
jgi:hypothetical protein